MKLSHSVKFNHLIKSFFCPCWSKINNGSNLSQFLDQILCFFLIHIIPIYYRVYKPLFVQNNNYSCNFLSDSKHSQGILTTSNEQSSLIPFICIALSGIILIQSLCLSFTQNQHFIV